MRSAVVVLGLGCVWGCRWSFAERADGGSGDASSCLPVADLLAYFPMNADDIVGSVLQDRSGNAHDGAIIGTPAPTIGTGKIGEGLVFPATTTAYE